MQLPALVTTSCKDIEQYLANQRRKPLPSPMPHEQFRIVKRLPNLQIGLFKYNFVLRFANDF